MSTPDPSTNPDPATTPGIEPGGGVAPGDTPPAEASATAELGGVDQPPPRNGGPTLKLVGLIFLVGALLVIALVIVWAVVYG